MRQPIRSAGVVARTGGNTYAMKVAGFLSYAHDDDTHDNGRISRLCERLQLAIRASAGMRDFAIFQDRSGIGWGKEWDRTITDSLDAVVLLFPIVSPLWLSSPHCRGELQRFRLRQSRLGLSDLILPIYYRESPLMQQDDAFAPPDERDVATLLRGVEFEDWRALRRTDETDPAYAAGIERLAERAAPLLRHLRQTVGDASADRTVVIPVGGGPTAALPGSVEVRVVDQMGRAGFTSIAAALQDAPLGARILVRPGHYNESLTIDRSIELVGDGAREDIVIEGTSAAALTFDTRIGIVRNITFRQRGENNFCVWVQQGRLTLEDCDLSSESLASLAVGNAADPRVRRNRIHDGSTSGITVYGQARGTYEDNEISDNDYAGIEVSDRAMPTFRRNRINGNGHAAIWVADEGGGVFEDNDLRGNALGAWLIATVEDQVKRARNTET